MLRRSPGFSAVVVLTLALGIGLNTAVFSVVDAVLLRPPAFAHPERVVWLTTLDPRIKDEFVTSHDFQAWREATSLERLVAYDEYDGRITVAGTSAPARIATVTDDFWEMAAARPALGRLPVSGQSEVLLSHAFFERWFGGNPEVVGKPAMVAGRADDHRRRAAGGLSRRSGAAAVGRQRLGPERSTSTAASSSGRCQTA